MRILTSVERNHYTKLTKYLHDHCKQYFDKIPFQSSSDVGKLFVEAVPCHDRVKEIAAKAVRATAVAVGEQAKCSGAQIKSIWRIIESLVSKMRRSYVRMQSVT